MALKVKAVEGKIKFTKDENDPGVYRYVMSLELYIALSQAKVIRKAALRRDEPKLFSRLCLALGDFKYSLETAQAEDFCHVLVHVGDAHLAAFLVTCVLESHEETQTGRRDVFQFAAINH